MIKSPHILLAALSLLLPPGLAVASEVTPQPRPAMARSDAPMLQMPDTSAPASFAPAESAPTPMGVDELATIAAGESVKVDVLSNQQLGATNSGNSVTADTVTSGDINFSANALTGFNGVGNFVTNTGNNNNLQGSISITIVTVPPLP